MVGKSVPTKFIQPKPGNNFRLSPVRVRMAEYENDEWIFIRQGEYSSENFIRIPSNEFAPFLEHLENVMVGTVEKSSVPLDGVDLWVLIEPWAHGITLSLHHTTYEPDPLTEITLDGVMVKKLHKTVVEFMNFFEKQIKKKKLDVMGKESGSYCAPPPPPNIKLDVTGKESELCGASSPPPKKKKLDLMGKEVGIYGASSPPPLPLDKQIQEEVVENGVGDTIPRPTSAHSPVFPGGGSSGVYARGLKLAYLRT